MRTKYKKKCLLILPIGLLLLSPIPFYLITGMGHPLLLLAIVPGVFFYLWGLSLLAKAKGLSQAILLTFILGMIPPLAILLLLEDKHRKF